MDDDIMIMNDEEVFEKVKKLMDKLDRDQELQELAERNGLDVKSSIRLNPTTKDNVAVSVLALELARRSHDPKYRNLVQSGLQKRKLKTEIINQYKDQANQLIKKYRDTKSV